MRQLTQQTIDRIIKAFFHYGYSLRNNEYVGIVVWQDDGPGAYNNIVGIIPNDDVTGQPLLLTVYSLACDCTWKEAFDTYTSMIHELVPELICIEKHEPSETWDLWEFGWKDINNYK